MDDLLFLAHRIPYPPNKGDKIRSWHILQHLAERYRVHLGCFVDHADDWRHTGVLRDLCASAHFAPLPTLKARARSLLGLARGEALSVACYRDAGLGAWVRRTVTASRPAAAFLYSSQTGLYLDSLAGIRTVMDFVDVDSDKWAQYAEARSGPLRWLYRREACTLAAFEARVAAQVDACVLVSEPEAALFRRLVPPAAHKTFAVTNSVDTARFSPARDYPDPFPAGTQAVVFTGAMDYWPNADAVSWFAREVLPAVRAAVPEAVFYVVGFSPAPEVRQLAALPGVVVTGAVDDTRDYLAHAACVVAPLRVARGVQNKVLEAMAMARPVVVSSQAAQGLTGVAPGELAVADGAPAMAAAVMAVLQGAPGGPDGAAARRRVTESYGWAASFAALDRVLEG
ncbi:MAG: TIGR03087 family PEP-CTERM/XrtA system glycosyltransferase [Alphaproteobacteria bacterium]|nr:TIGR03087 family PEP-CTERM/XrtA system glycosyltransferase [Alphaproteobacteria bacterium]